MFKELSINEMEKVDGGGPAAWFGSAIAGGIVYDVAKAGFNKLAHTPYTTTVIRGGQKYTVSYNGNPGW